MTTIGNKVTLNAITIEKDGFELTMERSQVAWACYIDGTFVENISNDDALGVAIKAVFEGTMKSMR